MSANFLLATLFYVFCLTAESLQQAAKLYIAAALKVHVGAEQL